MTTPTWISYDWKSTEIQHEQQRRQVAEAAAATAVQQLSPLYQPALQIHAEITAFAALATPELAYM